MVSQEPAKLSYLQRQSGFESRWLRQFLFMKGDLIMWYNKELQIVILKSRIEKLEKNFDNAKLVAKAKRRLRKLEANS